MAVTRAEEMGIQMEGTPMKTRPELNSNLHQQFTKQLQFDNDLVNGDCDSEQDKLTEDDNSSMNTAHSISKETAQTEKIEADELEQVVRQLNLASETMTQVL